MFLLKFIKSLWVQRDRFRKNHSMLISEFYVAAGYCGSNRFWGGGVGCLGGERGVFLIPFFKFCFVSVFSSFFCATAINHSFGPRQVLYSLSGAEPWVGMGGDIHKGYFSAHTVIPPFDDSYILLICTKWCRSIHYLEC